MVLAILGVGVPFSSAVAQDAAPEPNTLTWSVRPTDNEVGTGRSNFGYTADPGASLEDSIDITNRGDEAIMLDVYAADAYTPQGGGIDLLPRDSPSTDLGTWVEMSADTVTVEPGETVSVPFTLTVPLNATPGDHSGGIVTSISTESGQFLVDRRLGNRMFVRVQGELDPKLLIRDVELDYSTELNPFSSGTATVSFTVANTGNVRLDAHPTIALAGPFGLLGRQVRAEDIGEILPGSQRRYVVPVAGVWAVTSLSAEVTLEPVATNVADIEAGTTYPTLSARARNFALNWGHPLALVVLIAAFFGARKLRRQAKARTQAKIDRAVEQALAEQQPEQEAEQQPEPHAEEEAEQAAGVSDDASAI